MSPKYVIVIPDGAADEPQASLGGRTPLQAARTPAMDEVARIGLLGRSRNVPDRFRPGSDVATLSLFGYDPEVVYTGRAPLEAAAMGVTLGPGDWAVRCNLMTIQDGLMTDFTAGHIGDNEACQLINVLQQALPVEASRLGLAVEFHAGVSYRNLMVVRSDPEAPPFSEQTVTTPPHDVPDQPAADHLPQGPGGEALRTLMERGAEVVADHPVNVERVANGKRPANAIWLWGQGRAPRLETFDVQFGIRGAIVAAVDLVRGTAGLAGWRRIDVPGATGYLDTDYEAKGRAGIAALDDHDLVCVHIEAPDEASHEGRAEAKVESLERIDEAIVGPLLEALRNRDAWRILVSPDHATLIRTKAHARAPVPWTIAGTALEGSGRTYDEVAAAQADGPFLQRGHELMTTHFLMRDRYHATSDRTGA